jgi:hypothetical protein
MAIKNSRNIRYRMGKGNNGRWLPLMSDREGVIGGKATDMATIEICRSKILPEPSKDTKGGWAEIGEVNGAV